MADNWYYTKDGERLGPFSAGDMERMIIVGTLVPAVLVWREGMENWKKAVETELSPLFAKAPEPGEFKNCALCKSSFAVVDLVDVDGHIVCAECKRHMLRRLQEGIANRKYLDYAGFWIRLFALFLDCLILYLSAKLLGVMINPLLPYILSLENQTASFIIGSLAFVIMLMEFFYFVAFYHKKGATPGKMALGLKIVNADGTDGISLGQALGRCFVEILSGMFFLIGFLIMIFDERKRTLHDRLSGTLVVYKK